MKKKYFFFSKKIKKNKIIKFPSFNITKKMGDRSTLLKLTDPSTGYSTLYEYSDMRKSRMESLLFEHDGTRGCGKPDCNPYSLHALFCTLASREIYMKTFFPNVEETIISSSPWVNLQNATLDQFLIELHKLGVIHVSEMNDGSGMKDVKVLTIHGLTAEPLYRNPPPPTPQPTIPSPILEPQIDTTLCMSSTLATVIPSSKPVTTSPDIDNSNLYENDPELDENDIVNLFLQQANYHNENIASIDQHIFPMSPAVKRPRTPSTSHDLPLINDQDHIPLMEIQDGITIYNETMFPRPPNQTTYFNIDISSCKIIYT